MIKFHFTEFNFDRWKIAEIEGVLSAARCSTQCTITDTAAGADYIIGFGQSKITDPQTRYLPCAPNLFTWDTSDLPDGLRPGFYCSLPGSLYRSSLHRSFCYNLKWNEMVRAFPLSDADRLGSFVGGISSGIRGRMLRLSDDYTRHNIEIRNSTGPWAAMFDRSGLDVKAGFAESLRRAKFILCPRGNGVGSIRLFETMEAQRVPVIISDNYVLPEGIDWSKCSLRVKEKDIARIPEILRQNEARFDALAQAARQEWELHFDPRRLLDSMHAHLTSLRQPTAGEYRRGVQRVRFEAFKLELRRKLGRAVSTLRRQGKS